jgi:TolA-binding protein
MIATRSASRHRLFLVAAACCLWITEPTPTVGQSTVPPAVPEDSPAVNALAADICHSAMALEDRGLYDLAAAQWAALAEQFPKSPLAGQAHHFRGLCLFRLQRYDEAQAEFQRVVADWPQLDPDLVEQSYVNLGLAQFNLGQAAAGDARDKAMSDAVATFSAQLERFPDGKQAGQAWFYSAEACYAQSRLADAIRAHQMFLGRCTDDPLRARAIYGLGVAQQEVPNPGKAAETFQQFLTEFSQHDLAADVHLRCGEVLMILDRAVEAESHFAAAAAAERFADADEALERQAACRLAAKDYTAAARLYAALTACFADSPLVPAATVAAGKCHFLAGDPSQAIGWLRRGLELASADPRLSAEAAHWLVQALTRSGQVVTAVDVADKALRSAPPEMRVRLRLDRADALYEWDDRRTKAVDAYAAIAREFSEDPLAPHAAYMAVYAALAVGDPKAAVAHAAAFDLVYPNDRLAADVRHLAAEADLQLGNHVDAARDFERLLADFPEYEAADQVLRSLAEAQRAAGSRTAAIATLDRLIDEFPDSPLLDRAYYARGELHSEAGENTSAVRDFSQLAVHWGNSPLVPSALLNQARLEYGQQLLAPAHATLTRLLAKYPHHELATEARLTRATVRYAMGNWSGGITDLEAVLHAQPSRGEESDALYLRALCEAKLDRPGDAVATFECILRDDPQYGSADRVLYELAWACDEAGRPDRAVAAYGRLAKEHPDSSLAAEARYRIGQSLYSSGQFADAAQSFQAALASATDFTLRERAAHKLAWVEFSQNRYAEAERAFGEQLAEFPTGPLAADGAIMLAESRFGREDYAAALDAYRAALTGRPARDDLVALGLLHAAQAAARLGIWDQSLALLDQCRRAHPKCQWTEQVRYERGWALYHLDRLDEARQDFEAVAGDNSDELAMRARFMIGEIQFAKKQYDEAVRTFFQVAYGFGDTEAPQGVRTWQAEALFEAARCLQETKRIDVARKLYTELLERFPESNKAAHARHWLTTTKTR